MRLPPAVRREPRPILQELAEGFRFVWQTTRARMILFAVAVSSIFGMSFTVLLPVFADKILHAGARGYGFLMGAVGVGAVTGALRLAGRASTHGTARLITLGMGLFGISLCAMALSRQYVLSLVILAVVGASMITQLATTNTYLQRTTPNELRGRVLSIYSFVLVGLAPIGSFLAGALAQRLGGPWAVGLGGMACIAGALVFALQNRRGIAPAPPQCESPSPGAR